LVTVTHPHHPLFGQQLQVVRIQHRPPAEPDLIVALPDGSHAGIALSCTDYAPPTVPGTAAAPLLDLDGLRRLADYVATLQHRAAPAIVSAQPRAAHRAPVGEFPTPPSLRDA
jgi:hypothetical protein